MVSTLSGKSILESNQVEIQSPKDEQEDFESTPISESDVDSWEGRLRSVLGPRGYENSMRRSLQTVILYEAYRCIESSIPSLRPFQRKIAYIDMANALVNSLDGLLAPYQKEEILWRTGTSKEPMNAETAWKRRKVYCKELENIKDGVSVLMAGRTKEEALQAYLQLQYEAISGNSGPVPKPWIHTHNNAMMCYLMYYRGDALDPAFPPPRPPKATYVPHHKSSQNINRSGSDRNIAPASHSTFIQSAIPDSVPQSSEIVDALSRKKLLEEVKEHLALLNEFVGVIPNEEIQQRKRELFLAMPPAPPPAKRAKESDTTV